MQKAWATPSVCSAHLQYSPEFHRKRSELPVLINSSVPRAVRIPGYNQLYFFYLQPYHFACYFKC